MPSLPWPSRDRQSNGRGLNPAALEVSTDLQWDCVVSGQCRHHRDARPSRCDLRWISKNNGESHTLQDATAKPTFLAGGKSEAGAPSAKSERETLSCFKSRFASSAIPASPQVVQPSYCFYHLQCAEDSSGILWPQV